MEVTTCEVCCKKKTALRCDACGCASCKHCSFFIDEDAFEFPSLLPEKLGYKAFCPNCYHDSIEPEMDEYQDTLARAKQVNVFVKDQGAETRLIRRVEKPVRIAECDDREETLMRLAFMAAQKGYDTIVDVDVKSTKVGKGVYKKLVWSGSAVPVDPNRRK